MKTAHLLYCPMTGLGLYGGHRGRRWLRNRIEIFKQFVAPSIQKNTKENLFFWMSFRHEDRNDADVREFINWLSINLGVPCIFTFSGVCFWDDKYPDEMAHDRLIAAIHGAVPNVLNAIGDAEYILMTIQPSDDCYIGRAMLEVEKAFMHDPNLQAVGFNKGYVMDYKTKELKFWNPKTNPPFYTIRFAREVFMDARRHVEYAGIKSHEHLVTLNYKHLERRGFLVGTHGENISTVFNHPYAQDIPVCVDGDEVRDYNILAEFGLQSVPPLQIKYSWRKALMRKLPHKWQRKLRYIFGERFAAKIYDFLRS